MIFVIYSIVLSSYLIILLPSDVIFTLAAEDGVIENVGAGSFISASVVFFTAWVYSLGLENHFGSLRTQRNVFYFLLGILFLICFGEEISWGQRVFQWMTPGWLEEINFQRETNLHNIDLFHSQRRDETIKTGLARQLNMNRLFALFALGFCVVTPVAYKFSRQARKWCDWMGVPIVPLWIGGLFVAHAVIFQVVYAWLAYTDPRVGFKINELKESNYAVIFLILAFWELRSVVLSRRQLKYRAA